jgi:hypothetical protein
MNNHSAARLNILQLRIHGQQRATTSNIPGSNIAGRRPVFFGHQHSFTAVNRTQPAGQLPAPRHYPTERQDCKSPAENPRRFRSSGSFLPGILRQISAISEY